MRITHIRIRNLASLAGTQPAIVLGPEGMQGGLVAVTGPTGAGKSTILDCVCLALYGDTPRLRGRGEDYNSGNILTRGADDGFAEVDFFDDAQVPYRARWEMSRARTGQLRQPQMSLQRLSDQHQLSRGIRETQDCVTKIIGLDRNQFVGVVLLAQGSFSTFIGGDVKDRGALLERLSGHDDYSRLGRAAHVLLNQRKAAEKAIHDKLGENTPLDPAARSQLEADLGEANTRATSDQQSLEKAGDIAKHLAECLRCLSEVEKATAHHQQQHEAQAALSNERARLSAAEALEPLRAPLSVLDEREQQLRRNQEQLAQTAAEQRAAETEADAQQGQLTQAMGEMQALLQQLDQQQQRSAAAAPRDAEALSQAEHLQQQYQQALTDQQQTKKRSEEIAQQLPQAEQLSSEREQAAAKAQGALTQAEAAAQQAQHAHDDAVASQGDAEQRSAILHGRERLGEWLQRAQQLQQQRSQLGSDEKALAEKETADTAQEQQLQQQVQLDSRGLESAQDILHLAQTEATVSEHRHALVPGQPCPLCLQEVTSVPAAADQHHPLPQAKAKVDELQAQVQATTTQLAELRARIQAYPERRAQLAEQARSLQQHSDDLGQRYAELRAIDPALPEALSQVSEASCQELLGQAQSAVQTLKELSQAALSAHKTVHTATQALHQAQRLQQEAQAQVHNLRTQLGERQQATTAAQQQCELRQQQLSQALHDLAGQVQQPSPELSTAPAWLAQLRQAARRAQDWQQLHTAFFTVSQERLAEIHGKLPAGTVLPAHEAQLGEDASAAREHCQRSSDRIKQHSNAWLSARETVQRLQQRHSDLSASRAEHTSELQRQRTSLEESCHTQQLADIAALRAALLPQKEVDALRQRLKAADDACLQSQTALESAQSQLQRSHQHCGEALPSLAAEDFPQQLAQAQAQAAARREEWQQAAEASRQALATLQAQLRADEDNRRRAGALQQELEQAQAERQVTEQLHSLIGSHDGSKFRDLAQAFTLEHLVYHANRRLARFAPRYALRRRDGLALEVIDRDLADETRAVTTLSGGETFLVSLGLALALADLKRGRAHIGAVFIDEGFGSLDRDSLEHALAALEDVQADLGAQVVVISHVGDLASRWDDAVTVRRTSRGRSWLQVPGGPTTPPKDAAGSGGSFTIPIDLEAIHSYLSGQAEGQTRRAIAQALGIDNNAELAKALKGDPAIEIEGRKYQLRSSAHGDA